MNTTRDVVAPAMRAAAEDTCGPDADRVFTSDTRDLMAFFVTLRKLLREVCLSFFFIHPFSLHHSCQGCLCLCFSRHFAVRG